MKKIKRTKLIILFALILICANCFAWIRDIYHTDTKAVEAFNMAQSAAVDTADSADGMMVFKPENPVAGLIFYPGGKVEYSSYEPLMRECAQKGILCVLVKMPLNLAVLDVSAAEGICEKYEGVDKWYIGGHSLGGSMAASYLADNRDNFEGLVLLGSYSTEDFSEGDIDVLSVYGSEDKVMNKEKYDEYKVNLPESFNEYIIEGGNHAFFGMYGEQEGDGEASITNEEQISFTTEKIAEFIK